MLLTACDSSSPPQYGVSGTVSGLAAGQSITLNDSGDHSLDNSFGTVTVSNNGAFSFPDSISTYGSFNVSVTCTPEVFNLSGTVTGLASGANIVIQNNAADTLTISADGPFTFASPASYNSSYAVTVQTQPAGETCTVSNGVGSGVTAGVSNITVACSIDTYTISGNVSGLPNGSQFALQNNASDTTTVTQNGAFQFSTPVAFNGSYAVTVTTQPTGDTCTVSHGSGAGVTSDVTGVTVTCSPITFSVGGSVTGMPAGSQVTLYDNVGDPLTVTANGTFAFSTFKRIGHPTEE